MLMFFSWSIPKLQVGPILGSSIQNLKVFCSRCSSVIQSRVSFCLEEFALSNFTQWGGLLRNPISACRGGLRDNYYYASRHPSFAVHCFSFARRACDLYVRGIDPRYFSLVELTFVYYIRWGGFYSVMLHEQTYLMFWELDPYATPISDALSLLSRCCLSKYTLSGSLLSPDLTSCLYLIAWGSHYVPRGGKSTFILPLYTLNPLCITGVSLFPHDL